MRFLIGEFAAQLRTSDLVVPADDILLILVDDVASLGIEYQIAQQYLRKTGRYAPEAELRAWRESLRAMADVLDDVAIPVDTGVGIEFGIPQTSKRIDFLLSGRNGD